MIISLVDYWTALVKRQARDLIPLWLPEDIDDIPLQIWDPEDTQIIPYQPPEEEEDPSNSNASMEYFK